MFTNILTDQEKAVKKRIFTNSSGKETGRLFGHGKLKEEGVQRGQEKGVPASRELSFLSQLLSL